LVRVDVVRPDPASAAPLVERLAGELREAGVVYCHFKSNRFLRRAELAETDLDLLVSRRHVRAFRRVLDSCGFVSADRPHATSPPGVAHYFAYDPAVDRFVHVHAHRQLIVGHDRTKNYRLPIEEPFLASASTTSVLPTPAPAFEYALLVIRMVLKYAVIDEMVWTGAKRARPRPSRTEREEHADLRAQITHADVAAVVDQHLRFVGRDLFAAAEDVALGTAPLARTAAVGRRMEAQLQAHARRSPSVDALVRLWRRVALSARRRTLGRKGYRLDGGGAIIAIMGGDGAGKTTALREIGTWLEEHFDVVTVHLGKPPWSATTYAVRAGLKVAGTVVPALSGPPAGTRAQADEGEPSATEYRRLLWFACKARDRYLAYRRATRAAAAGSIVLSDRFPHPALHRTDVPQIARLTGGHDGGRLLRWLIRLEQRYHDRVAPPDLAIVLRLDPLEAARRKTDEPYDYVVARATEIYDIDWSGTGVHVVDAGQPPAAVVAEIKALIWASLA
jgi:thymidylate kinase